MRVELIVFLIYLSINQALANTVSLCEKNSEDYIPANKEELTGTWSMDWKAGATVVSGQSMPQEYLPPKMEVELSFEDDKLKLEGVKIKRKFETYWTQEAINNSAIPSPEPFQISLLDNNTINELECNLDKIPYLRGASISKRKSASTGIHLWILSPTRMLGLSVANNGPAVSSLSFVLIKK